MELEKLQTILKAHREWQINSATGGRANLGSANLGSANLRGADLRRADLRRANLGGANLWDANLRRANLGDADLWDANLRHADLRGANLTRANLQDADLRGANLTRANLGDAGLGDANLRHADLRGANLRDADLRGADLRGANLSATEGLVDSAQWLRENFESDKDGLLVYKGIGYTDFCTPDYWTIEPGSVLEEVVNPCRTIDCACGVNFATQKWIEQNYPAATIWKCRIEWIDLAGVVVPYGTFGKARCARLTLLETV